MTKKVLRKPRVGHIWIKFRPRIGHIKPRDLAGYIKEKEHGSKNQN